MFCQWRNWNYENIIYGKKRTGETKLIICGKDLDTINPSWKYPCSVCRKGVSRNSIFCRSCDAWVHKKSSGIKGRLVAIPDFKCHRCLGLGRPIDVRPVEHVSLGDKKLEVVDILEMEYPQIAPLQESIMLGKVPWATSLVNKVGNLLEKQRQSNSNGIRTHDQLVCKRTLNHSTNLAKWLSCAVSTYLYVAFDSMLLSCHERVLEWSGL